MSGSGGRHVRDNPGRRSNHPCWLRHAGGDSAANIGPTGGLRRLRAARLAFRPRAGASRLQGHDHRLGHCAIDAEQRACSLSRSSRRRQPAGDRCCEKPALSEIERYRKLWGKGRLRSLCHHRSPTSPPSLRGGATCGGAPLSPVCRQRHRFLGGLPAGECHPQRLWQPLRPVPRGGGRCHRHCRADPDTADPGAGAFRPRGIDHRQSDRRADRRAAGCRGGPGAAPCPGVGGASRRHQTPGGRHRIGATLSRPFPFG